MKLLILALLALPAWGAWTSCRPITVGGSVVTSGPHVDFRFAFIHTADFLKSTGSGGEMTNASAYDIGFYTASSCTSGALDYKRISHDLGSGAVIYKVRIPSPGLDNGTVLYVGTGDASISTNGQNSAGVYASSVGGAWGLDDDAANTTVADGTGNSATGTSVANTSTKTVTAKIHKGLTFNGTTDAVNVANNSTLNASTGLTITAWVKRLRTGSYDWLVFKENSAGSHFVYGIEFTDTNKLQIDISDGTSSSGNVRVCTGATSVTSTTVYQHVAVTYNATGSASAVYLNGVSDATGTPGSTGCNSGTTYSGNLTSSTGQLSLGRTRYVGSYYAANVELDDVEVENTPRSSGWIATEYSNEGTPGSFFTVGSPLGTSRPKRIFVQ